MHQLGHDMPQMSLCLTGFSFGKTLLRKTESSDISKWLLSCHLCWKHRVFSLVLLASNLIFGYRLHRIVKTCSCAGFWELKHLYLYVMYLQQFIQFSSGPMQFLLPWSCPFVILLLPYAPISLLLPYLLPLGSSSSPRYLLYKTREVCPMSSFLFCCWNKVASSVSIYGNPEAYVFMYFLCYPSASGDPPERLLL